MIALLFWIHFVDRNHQAIKPVLNIHMHINLHIVTWSWLVECLIMVSCVKHFWYVRHLPKVKGHISKVKLRKFHQGILCW